ncbi:MAG: hypothetical protein JWM20_849 [Patescibacteria group bacterium]|nr:hypothetical protein [Patescibacteria group bacterium]
MISGTVLSRMGCNLADLKELEELFLIFLQALYHARKQKSIVLTSNFDTYFCKNGNFIGFYSFLYKVS